MPKRKTRPDDHASEVLSQLYTIRSMTMIDMFRAGVATKDFCYSSSLSLLNKKISQTRLEIDTALFCDFVKRANAAAFE